MSELISRSELLNAFNNTGIQITFDLPVEEILGEDVDIDDFSMLVQDAIQAYKKMVIDTIKNQPTAYDIGKVVEELEKNKRKLLSYAEDYEKVGNWELAEIYSTRANEYTKAIEIVKQCVVSDDVCEWKRRTDDNFLHTSCNNRAGAYSDEF